MNKRLRRVSLPVAGFLAGIVLAPAAAVAATASFSSGGSGAAVSATNTSGTGPAVLAVLKGGGSSAAVFGRNYATGDGSNAFYSKSYVTSGEHYGIWGVDASPYGAAVRGQSTNSGGTGVVGESGANGVGVLGAGAYGVVSDGELVGLYHLIDQSAYYTNKSGDIAGTVTVTAGQATATVTFEDPLYAQPSIVLTPTSQPNGSYWVEALGDPGTTGVTGFTVHTTSGAGDVTFNYVAVGFHPGTVAPAAMTSKTSAVRPHKSTAVKH